MDNEELLHTLAKEYEGDLLQLSDEKRIINVKYTSGALPIFSKLEILVVMDKDSLFSQDPDFQLFSFRNFYPVVNLLQRDELQEEVINEIRQHVSDGLFSFIRPREKSTELIVVAVGNVENKGVYYYSSPESSAVPLIEITGENGDSFIVYIENLEIISEL